MKVGMLEIGYTTIVQVVNFFILLFFLNIYLYKPLLGAIHQRKEKVQSTLDEADSINAQAQDLKEEYEKKISQIKDQAASIIQQATQEAEKLRTEMVKEGRREVRHINELAFAEMEQERNRISLELKKQVSSMAVAMATKILQESLDNRTQQGLIKEFIERIKK